jgi:glyceraldehyde 3-phosphate dehydrogenase
MLRIAINGYGRIGRNILRAFVERSAELANRIEIVAINDLGDGAINTHLTRFDSVHGRFPVPVEEDGNYLHIRRHAIDDSNPNRSRRSHRAGDP